MKKNHKTKTTALAKTKTVKPKQTGSLANEAKAATTSREATRRTSKQSIIIGMLKGTKGATVAELADATGWQKHSIQGAMSGALKKKLGLTITSEKEEKRGRVYRIA